jgi:predicted DNA-binding protein
LTVKHRLKLNIFLTLAVLGTDTESVAESVRKRFCSYVGIRTKGLTFISLLPYNTYEDRFYREAGKMPGTVKKTRYFLDLDPELRNRVKAFAALKGKTMRDWLTEAIIAKLEDEIDASEGLASLANVKGTVSLENYLESRQGNSKKAE